MTTDPIERDPLPAVVDWLTARRPQDVDQTLASRASSLGVSLRAIYETRYPTGSYGEHLPSKSVVVGYDVGGPPEPLGDVVTKVERAMTPAPASTIAKWLACLSVRVNRRAEDPLTERLRLEDSIRNLAAYPADVVQEALLVQVWKFWPTWYELHEVCERLVTPRRRMLAALHAKKVGEPAQEVVRTRASDEAIKSILDKFGFTPERFEAVKVRPMARSEAELMEGRSGVTRPHASEGTEPGRQEMQTPRQEATGSGLPSNAMNGGETASAAEAGEGENDAGCQEKRKQGSRA